MKLRHLLAFLLLAAAAFAQQGSRVYLKSKAAQEHHLPLSNGVMVGDTLYLSGAIGVSSSQKTPPSPEEEARATMEQVKQTVEQAGMTMDDVVSVQVFCTDLANYDAFNKVYATYFHVDYPARAFIGVDKLVLGARYEVMGIAVKRSK
jgi:reactive intermediate/imine deaminase